MKKIPSSKEVRQTLGSSSLDSLSNSIYKAISYSNDHFEKSGHPFSSTFFTHHVRVRFCELLRITPGVTVEDIENDGVQFVLNRYRFRCLNSHNGDVPPPGDSQTLLEFCKQHGRFMPTQLRLIDVTGEPRPVEIPDIDLNLFLIWDYTKKRELDYVHIVCPRDATYTKVFIEWTAILNNPLTAGIPVAESTSEMHGDLIFRLRDDTTDKEEELDEGAE